MQLSGVFWKKSRGIPRRTEKAGSPKRRKRVCLSLLSALILTGTLQGFLSCATVPYVQKEDKVVKLVELINRGGVNEVPGLASTPFLVDGEIVLLQKDLSEFWDNLHKAGFTIRSPKVTQNRFAMVEDAKYFRDSMEVRTFFKKYTDRDTSLVQVRSVDGTFYLLLGREVKGYPRMLGFGGPVQ